MRRAKIRWLPAGLVCLALWPVAVLGQEEVWKKYSEEGLKAYQQGRYAETNQRELLRGWPRAALARGCPIWMKGNRQA